MTRLAIPLDDLPSQQDLPSLLILEGGEVWQQGHRLVDRTLADSDRVTAGSWLSGCFATKPSAFGGCEWLTVLRGRIAP